MPDKRISTLIVLILFLLSAGIVRAQVTENHIGVRGGLYGGIYYQNLVTSGTAERSFYALLSADDSSVRLTVMRLTYEMSLNELSDNLFIVWGYGGHLGFNVSDNTYFLGRKYQFEYERFRPVAGIDAFGGLEYRFLGMPMTIGLSIKPYVEIMVPGFVTIKPWDLGLSFAYRF